MEVAVLLLKSLKILGCIVQDVLPGIGVQTTSNLDLGTVSGVMANAVRKLGVLQAVVIGVARVGVRMAVVVSYLVMNMISIGWKVQ